MSAPDPSGRIAGLKQAIRRLESVQPARRGRGRRPGDASGLAGLETAVAGFGFEGLDRAFAGGGLQAGTHQAMAPPGQEPAAAAFALALLARRLQAAARGSALLVQAGEALAEEGSFGPEGLRALGLDLDRIGLLVARTGAEAVQAADEALKSGAALAVLLDGGRGARFDLALTRRFNLAAQRSGALALLVGGAPEATSAALSRWRVSAAASRRRALRGARPGLGPPAFDLALTRNRFGGLGRWTMEWDCDAHVFRPAPPALPLSVAPLAAGRAGAADEGDRRAAGPGRKAG